jgi:malate dehydrogenase (oxaloacetate-decarboxylating)(NADP+)
LYPEPKHKEIYIRSQIYSVEYEELIQDPYDWPNEDMRHGFSAPFEPKKSLDEEED